MGSMVLSTVHAVLAEVVNHLDHHKHGHCFYLKTYLLKHLRNYDNIAPICTHSLTYPSANQLFGHAVN